eukprot:CAMPEP_0177160980 /NCGR_PEP_ID=MMETSP0367-20130122/5114_1 /TAXON_ID=447022 ORGANISM="Scrippsiella hangoei-like, Strain SHHI-4" /NCGR_SAMPLE_ID=MMETSP0367 /ASSEMBLY_ACC=CAM_ASM_000362 /LENGTH=164 /DNA_ID=CAMNT_0018606667 /DNA_START=96 /DNA_END=590 /DNA_ORIENTATION=+
MSCCFSFVKCCGNKEKEELRAENVRMRKQLGTLTDLMEKQTQALMRMEAKANAAEQRKRQSDNESVSSFSSKLRSHSVEQFFGCSSNPKRQNSQSMRRSNSVDSVTSRGSRKSNPKENIALAHYGFPDMYQHEEKLAEHLGRFEQWGENKHPEMQLSGSGLGRL